MIRIDRRGVLLGFAAAGLVRPAVAAGLPEPTLVPIELFEDALALEAGVRAGSARGDVTLVEFFDYNCPFCRRSAADLPALLAAEPDLAYVLVNYPILGAPSIEASRVALAFAETEEPRRYLDLHQALFHLTGKVDGERSLNEAERLGADRTRLADRAASDRITVRLDEALRVGHSLGLAATPSLVVGPDAYVGYIPLEEKRAIIARARA